MFIHIHSVSSLTHSFNSASVKTSEGHGLMSEFVQLTSYLHSPHMSVISPQLLPQTWGMAVGFLCMCRSLCFKNRCVILNNIAQAFKGGSTDFSSFQHVSTLTVLNEWNVNILFRLHWIQWSNTMEVFGKMFSVNSNLIQCWEAWGSSIQK